MNEKGQQQIQDQPETKESACLKYLVQPSPLSEKHHTARLRTNQQEKQRLQQQQPNKSILLLLLLLLLLVYLMLTFPNYKPINVNHTIGSK